MVERVPGDFSLSVAGARYEGWTSVSLTRSLEQLAPAFSLGLSGECHEISELLPISEGAPCVLEWGRYGVIPGHIVDSDSTTDARSYTFTVSGRAKTGDLVDCSAIHKSGEWQGRTLVQIAKDLCSPFGLEAKADADPGAPFSSFSIQDGETVFECLDRGARMRSLLLASDFAGNPVITKVGTRKTRTVLERGVNITRSSRRGSWRDRHSEYIVKAQSQGDDGWFGDSSAAIKRTVKDDRINRYRPLIVMAEDQEASGSALERRAKWERNTRYGKSLRVGYSVAGWENADGLWEPNVLVEVRDPFYRIKDELLIVSATLRRNTSGTVTELELTRPEAFDVLKELPPKKKESWF